MPKRAIRLGPDAVGQLKALSAGERSRLKAAMQTALGEDDATIENKNRFRLHRPSGQFEFEFRDGDLRVFYLVQADQVFFFAMIRKPGSHLVFGCRKFSPRNS